MVEFLGNVIIVLLILLFVVIVLKDLSKADLEIRDIIANPTPAKVVSLIGSIIWVAILLYLAFYVSGKAMVIFIILSLLAAWAGVFLYERQKKKKDGE